MEHPPDLLSDNPFLNSQASMVPISEWTPPSTTLNPFFGENPLPPPYFPLKIEGDNKEQYKLPGLPTAAIAAPPAPFVFPPTFILPVPSIPPPIPVTFPSIVTNPTGSTLEPINIDPEAIMNVPEIIQHWGYPVEEHQVVTSDGYILTLHRIPCGKKNSNSTAIRPVVFLQHGLLCTSSIWLLNLPHQSAGFVFADQGFDVWLGNMRGNVYSKQHVTLSSDSNDFWKFSWEEMAEYDLPAMIDYVLNKTDQSSLYYVGHSQGTLTMLAKLSEDQKFASKLVYRLFGDNEFLSNNIFTRLLTNIICDKSVNNPLCENFIFSVSGPNSNQFNSSRIGIYLAHNPAGTSSRNMLHFAQMVHNKRIESFDRGKEANIRSYGKSVPPQYNLTKVHCDIYLFYSDYDWLASAADVEQFLIPTLPRESVKFARKLDEFNHNDFLWGLRARKEIYDPITNIIKVDFRRLSIQHNMNSYFKSYPHPIKTLNDVSDKINVSSIELD
ncbi:hydrolase, alpha/beta domain protein [Necator americanus]|uniref:Hydrolase, alpha/beta domain protein n=1 Tax=Necator americanus TaxID=51031 RepID=W2T803_NECAM|nr:hydrolase, alpha/beta domain protein [Necator americanus]ETN78150.1 hydrolase, alpha/beta domain protein [Necator americanus]